jgi:hypothetical protein
VPNGDVLAHVSKCGQKKRGHEVRACSGRSEGQRRGWWRCRWARRHATSSCLRVEGDREEAVETSVEEKQVVQWGTGQGIEDVGKGELVLELSLA